MAVEANALKSRFIPAMVLNTLTAWPWRGRVRFASVDFNPPAERQRCVSLLMDRCGLALDHGLLQLFLADVEGGDWAGWHSPVAKNTAHMAGLGLCGEDVVLVGLDGDNLITTEFIEYMLQHAERMTTPKVGGVSPTGGVTPLPSLVGMTCRNLRVKSTNGRVACGGKVFLHLRGYDEALGPAGYQDRVVAVAVVVWWVGGQCQQCESYLRVSGTPGSV